MLLLLPVALPNHTQSWAFCTERLFSLVSRMTDVRKGFNFNLSQ
jgi:hypothetical protein